MSQSHPTPGHCLLFEPNIRCGFVAQPYDMAQIPCALLLLRVLFPTAECIFYIRALALSEAPGINYSYKTVILQKYSHPQPIILSKS